MITPRQYEFLVAEHFTARGYTTSVTAYSNDYGLDVLAENNAERIAIQAKLYGRTSRKVNRQMIMELYGVCAYFDCDRAVLATDGQVLEDARAVAAKLGVEIFNVSADYVAASSAQPELMSGAADGQLPISVPDAVERIWTKFVVPLEGKTLTASATRTNRILKVDWSGIDRMTSTGRRARIDYEIFRLTIEHLLRHGTITRDQINQNYAKRASSGVVLVLAQVPLFRLERGPTRLVYDGV